MNESLTLYVQLVIQEYLELNCVWTVCSFMHGGSGSEMGGGLERGLKYDSNMISKWLICYCDAF